MLEVRVAVLVKHTSELFHGHVRGVAPAGRNVLTVELSVSTSIVYKNMYASNVCEVLLQT